MHQRLGSVLSLALGIATFSLANQLAHATVAYCGGHFSPTPETSRFVYSDLFTGSDSEAVYEKQFLKAVENHYGLGDDATNSYGKALHVQCNFYYTADEARQQRESDRGQASRYVNESGAVQLLKFDWIPDDAVKVGN
jgi:hypothetical protein